MSAQQGPAVIVYLADAAQCAEELRPHLLTLQRCDLNTAVPIVKTLTTRRVAKANPARKTEQTSSVDSWYCSKKSLTSWDLRSTVSCSFCSRSVSSSSWDVQDLVLSSTLVMLEQLLDKPLRLAWISSRACMMASSGMIRKWRGCRQICQGLTPL